ncbi:MAG: divalent-cation tolerance protein CutA [Alphaproteobacteria bacterium]|nr:divalent-cation tolerance protein CutA [Alphaproteobacteria bacterium]
MSATLVYVTASSRDEALKIARTAVEERLAACANVLAPITSVYWWDGKVQEEGEVSFILKTRDDLVSTLTARIKALHSYSCPCVVAWPVTQGNPDFLAWIASETKK